MAMEKDVAVVHPEGEEEVMVVGGANQTSTVDTFGGMNHVKWDETAAVTPFGQLAFFIEFLKTAGLWDGWVEECPVAYESPNAPAKADVLGTMKPSATDFSGPDCARNPGFTAHHRGQEQQRSRSTAGHKPRNGRSYRKNLMRRKLGVTM